MRSSRSCRGRVAQAVAAERAPAARLVAVATRRHRGLCQHPLHPEPQEGVAVDRGADKPAAVAPHHRAASPTRQVAVAQVAAAGLAVVAAAEMEEVVAGLAVVAAMVKGTRGRQSPLAVGLTKASISSALPLHSWPLRRRSVVMSRLVWASLVRLGRPRARPLARFFRQARRLCLRCSIPTRPWRMRGHEVLWSKVSDSRNLLASRQMPGFR